MLRLYFMSPHKGFKGLAKGLAKKTGDEAICALKLIHRSSVKLMAVHII